MSAYRCVILGCGRRAYGHARPYKLVSRANLVACCDLDAERRTKFAAQFGVAAYADVVEMIRKEKPDLIHIVTPPMQRVDLMTMVQQQKVPACLVEKPIACEVADWKQLCALADKPGTKFGVNHQVRWQPFLVRCGEAVRSGKLGKLLFLDFSAGMNISAQGTHILDWATYLNGESQVKRVFGAASGVSDWATAHKAPDMTTAQVVFENGVFGMWSNGPAVQRVSEDPTIWKHLRVAAYAEQGRAVFEEMGKWEVVSPQGREGGMTTPEEWAANNDRAQAGLVNSMLDWLDSDSRPCGTHLQAALRQWNAVLGLYASVLWHKPVDIPFDPPDDLFARLHDVLKG